MSAPSAAEVFEKVPTTIFADSAAAAKALAQEVKEIIETRNKAGQPAVLGMATGSTPVPFYRELIRLHKEEGLSFNNVITFNLDEYFGLAPDHPESYARFMAEQIFDHIDIPKENINIPSGMVPGDQVFAHCRQYEEKIASVGDTLALFDLRAHLDLVAVASVRGTELDVRPLATAVTSLAPWRAMPSFSYLRPTMKPVMFCRKTSGTLRWQHSSIKCAPFMALSENKMPLLARTPTGNP